MRWQRIFLALVGIAFLVATLARSFGIRSAQEIALFESAIIAYACLGAAIFNFTGKFRAITKWALFAALFSLFQSMLYSAVLIVALFGERSFSWNYVVYGPCGIALALLCLQLFRPHLRWRRYEPPEGPGPFSAA